MRPVARRCCASNTYQWPIPVKAEIRIRQTAIGVNFIDVYHRTGLYNSGAGVSTVTSSSFIPGLEAVGHIESVGAGVKDLKVGDRVCYGNGPLGGYAEARIIPAESVVLVPPALRDETSGRHDVMRHDSMAFNHRTTPTERW